MKRPVVVAVLLCLVGVAVVGVGRSSGQPLPDPAVGQVTPPQVIAVVDLVRIFNECAQIKDLNDMIRQQTEELNREGEQRRKVIRNKQEELTGFQAGTADYEARRKDLLRLNIEANAWLKLSEEDLDRQKFDWTRIIYEKAVIVVSEIAQQKGYSAVLQRTVFKPDEVETDVQALRRMIQDRIVVAHAAEIDLTEEVIRRLDAEYKASGGLKRAREPDAVKSPEAEPTQPTGG